MAGGALPAGNGCLPALTLGELRGYRRTLTVEEAGISYWRRVIQARADLLARVTHPSWSWAFGSSPDVIGRVLAPTCSGTLRDALLSVIPAERTSPLPGVIALWERVVDPCDASAVATLLTDLRHAEGELSAYRKVLHRRLDAATDELVARYREQPTLCLSALS